MNIKTQVCGVREGRTAWHHAPQPGSVTSQLMWGKSWPETKYANLAPVWWGAFDLQNNKNEKKWKESQSCIMAHNTLVEEQESVTLLLSKDSCSRAFVYRTGVQIKNKIARGAKNILILLSVRFIIYYPPVAPVVWSARSAMDGVRVLRTKFHRLLQQTIF